MTRVKTLLWEALFRFPSLARRLFMSRAFCKLAFNSKFALNNLDEKLNLFLPVEANFFIEIGGNDGISQSNTKRLELFEGWTGVLVEPFPGNFERMALTRAMSTRLFNAACVPFDYTSSHVELTYSDLMTVSDSLPTDISDSKEHALSGENWLKNDISVHQFLAPARTLQSILEEAGAPKRIGFFSLDVEGAELAVLRGVDHDSFRFDWLLVESRSPDQIEVFLVDVGYELVEKLTEHDYLFRDSTVTT